MDTFLTILAGLVTLAGLGVLIFARVVMSMLWRRALRKQGLLESTWDPCFTDCSFCRVKEHEELFMIHFRYYTARCSYYGTDLNAPDGEPMKCRACALCMTKFQRTPLNEIEAG